MRSSSLLNFAWLAAALIASGCTVITSLDGWTFGDEDPGQTDGGAMDASQADAGPACTADLTDCSGECVDLDSSSEHCGACMNACPTPPNTVALCTAGTCGWECAAGFADCNGEPADGCEVDTANDPLHCGACESSCVNDLASLSCREGTCRPSLLWLNDFGDTGAAGVATVTAVALDPEGNVYIAGWLTGTVNLRDTPITSEGSGFVASFTSRGAYRWWVGEGWPEPATITFDESGSTPKVHVAGSFSGTADFGGSSLSSRDGSVDIFIASFDAATGGHIGSRSWGGSSTDRANGIGVDATGNLYLTGTFQSSDADFGGPNLINRGGYDIFIASYPPDYALAGAARWTDAFGSAGDDHGQAIAVDASGNVSVTGSFSGDVNFGNLPPSMLRSEGSQDVFVASFNLHGTHHWSTQGNAQGSAQGNGIALDADGNVYVTGSFSGTADFGGDPLNAKLSDVFLASYDASGAHRWARRAGGADVDVGVDIAVSPEGEVYSTGSFVQAATFGDGELTSWDQAGFIAAHGAMDGAHRASFVIGGPAGSAESYSVAAGGGLVCTVGPYIGTVRIGEANLITGDERDGFLACFEP